MSTLITEVGERLQDDLLKHYSSELIKKTMAREAYMFDQREVMYKISLAPISTEEKILIAMRFGLIFMKATMSLADNLNGKVFVGTEVEEVMQQAKNHSDGPNKS